jgi:hypothetical protein
MKTKIKLIAIDNLIKIAYPCRNTFIMMIPDKLYKFAKAIALHKLLNTKAALLIQTIEDLYIRDAKAFPVDIKPYHDSLSDVARQSLAKLSFKFLGEEMLLECQIDATGEMAMLTTYNIVDDRDDYPHKKMVRLDSLNIKIDKVGNVIPANHAVEVDNAEFVYGYVELLFDWYSNDREIAA